MAVVNIDCEQITNWASFHLVFKEACGFPDFYGANMDAWIDCFSDLRDEYGMTCFKLADDEVLHIELHHVADLNERLPEIVAELVKCTALVNARYVDWEQSPAISLVRVG